MKIIDLLNGIENDEIEDGTIFEVIGDFFYKLIIIDKNLYCINEMTKKLEILDSKYIGRFDNKQYEIIELSNKLEEENYGTTIIKTDDIKIEKPDKIEKITISEDEKSLFFDDKYQDISLHNISPIEVAFAIKINEIIDKINGDDIN